jgi:hypothetical protein
MAEAQLQRITFRINEFEALDNPEAVGRAEWSLRVFVNDIERWRSSGRHRVLEGNRAIVDAEFHVDIAPHSKEMSMRVEAEEHDLGPNDHAEGSVRLYRSQDFGGDNFSIDLKGDNAHLRLRCSTQIEAI